MKKGRSLLALLTVIIMALLTACGGTNGGKKDADAAGSRGESGGGSTQSEASGSSAQSGGDGQTLHRSEVGNLIRPLGESAQTKAIIPFVNKGTTSYVPLADIINVLEFRSARNGKTYDIGDNGLDFQLTMDSNKIKRGDESVTVRDAPTIINGAPHIPVSAVVDLFKEDMVFDVTGSSLVVHPADGDFLMKESDGHTDVSDTALDFADDQNDPFKGAVISGEKAARSSLNAPEDLSVWAETENPVFTEQEAIEAAAAKTVDMNKLISTAQRYLGVRYQFSAAPYPQSGRFDCSSYTKYIFGKFRINLPRSARDQSRFGQTVSRTSLRKGDLLFFTVPGRFKSNKVAGHVGIYIGNGMMIHAINEPKDGVQYRSIKSAYWKQHFLWAKRVA